MASVLDRLLHLGRRRPEPDRPPADQRTVDIDALPLEGATSGPASMLLPAAIFRQVLFDPTEFTPAWLRARPGPAPEPGPTGPTDEPQPAKRSRRPKTNASPGPKTNAVDGNGEARSRRRPLTDPRDPGGTVRP